MALVNAFSSLSIGVNASPSSLGFKKAVAAFAMPARVTSGRSAVFEITAKQNKQARTILVRVFTLCDVRGTRASRCFTQSSATRRSRSRDVDVRRGRRCVGDEGAVVASVVVLLPTSSFVFRRKKKRKPKA